MFFPERIVGINPSDKVLEVGPGGTPHPRSDVFLEKVYASEEAWASQRGHAPKLTTDKRVVYYDGGRFPFEDNEFDYVICSHVIEHVEDVEVFLSELFRVAPRGYLEYPTVCYDYLYNFYDHLNLVKFKDGSLLYLRKEDTALKEFLPVQKLLHHSFGMGYSKLVDDLKPVMFEGFEWTQRFAARRASGIDELVADVKDIPPLQDRVNCNLLRYLARRIKRLFLRGN